MRPFVHRCASTILRTLAITPLLLTLPGCMAAQEDEDDLSSDDPLGAAEQALAGDNLWNKRMGGPGDQIAVDIATDASGNVFFVGNFRDSFTVAGTTLTSAGGADVLVVKIDKGGTPLWARSFGGPGDQRATLVATDPEGNVLLQVVGDGPIGVDGGEVALGGVTLVKLAGSGAHLWSRGLDTIVTDLAVAPTGHVLLAGSFMGTLDLGAGTLTSSASGPDGFVARLDAAGNALWTRALGGEGDQQALAVAADSAGNVIVGGHHGTQFDFGGATITDTGSSNAFVAKFSPTGTPLWSQHPNPGPEQGAIHAVAADHLGNVVATGFDRQSGVSGRSLSVLKFAADGTPTFRRAFAGTPNTPGGNPGSFRGRHIAVDPSNNILVITGEMQVGLEATVDLGGGPLPPGILVARFDPSGNHGWSKSWELYGYASLAVRSNGSVFVGGSFTGPLNVGGWPMTNLGGYDLFVSHLSP
ncbi:hypothetical protein [Chondromyces crocatus]|nr:hypothetical protein [Chondromyces crocatus]